jgi:phosphatase and actin regulator 4
MTGVIAGEQGFNNDMLASDDVDIETTIKASEMLERATEQGHIDVRVSITELGASPPDTQLILTSVDNDRQDEDDTSMKAHEDNYGQDTSTVSDDADDNEFIDMTDNGKEAPKNITVFPLPKHYEDGLITRIIGSLRLQKSPPNSRLALPNPSGSFVSSNSDQASVNSGSLKEAPSLLNRLVRQYSNEKSDHTMVRAASADSVGFTKKVPVKSILKKTPTPVQNNPLLDSETEAKSSVKVELETETTAGQVSNEYTGIKKLANTPLLSLQDSDASYRASAPDLRLKKMFQSRDSMNISRENSSSNDMKKLGSSKTLSFDLQSVAIIEVHSKNNYNRKPDSNITFKKLTPKLKNEIREELNKFKREEMNVHEESAHHTVFH